MTLVIERSVSKYHRPCSARADEVIE